MQGSGTDRNDTGQTARNIVLRQLSSAPKTRQQLSEKLADREIPEEIIREVLDRFEEVELIDDAAFAQSWVRSRHRAKRACAAGTEHGATSTRCGRTQH